MSVKKKKEACCHFMVKGPIDILLCSNCEQMLWMRNGKIRGVGLTSTLALDQLQQGVRNVGGYGGDVLTG